MRYRLFFLLAALAVPAAINAQGRGGRGGPPLPPKQAAAFDITGYWVSVVTEDWRFRMVTPPKGDFPGIPLSAEGRKIAMAWDPANDAANACKPYGAAGLMRVPSRFQFTWQDDNTLKLESDAGAQTRLLHFGVSTPPAGTAASLQGYSVAQWQNALGGRGGRGGQGQPGAAAQRGGSLKVVTTNLSGGYLRWNGVPYGEKTTVTEYYDLVRETDGEQWLIIKTTVEDPQYLNGPFITSTNLKKDADGAAKWKPAPCAAK